MAKSSGLNQSAISRIGRAFDLEPHRTKTFKLTKDPLFTEKVRDVVGLYLKPPNKDLVLCADGKSGIQALNLIAPLLPMRSGQVERRTLDYTRHGTTARCQRRHRPVELGRFLDAIDDSVPAELDVRPILDNLAIQKTGFLHRWLA